MPDPPTTAAATTRRAHTGQQHRDKTALCACSEALLGGVQERGNPPKKERKQLLKALAARCKRPT
eukprot:13990398-Alexandrium_andersonii.AAC.1